MDNAFETAENKTELVLGNGITYYGQTKNGVPHGIGKRFDKSVMSEFPGTISDMEYLGYFTEGTETDFIMNPVPRNTQSEVILLKTNILHSAIRSLVII